MTLESIHPFIQWVAEHPTWSGFIVFLISLAESLAVVGIIVPGVILMTAIGRLIGAGKLPGLETMIWAMLGAVAGDGVSYWLGHYYRDKLTNLWPFNKFPMWLDRGTSFFKAHGGKSIILGRFVGPVRPTIPVIAGIMGMKPQTFLFFNVVSAIAWAPVYCLPGILIGASLGQLSPKMASTVLSLVLGILFIVWLLFYLILKIILFIKSFISKVFKKIWLQWQQSGYLNWLQQVFITAENKQRGQLGTVFLFMVGIVTFTFVVLCINSEEGVANWNEPVYQCFRSLYNDPLASWAVAVISLGEPLVLLSAASIAGIFIFRQHKPTALCWFGTIILGTCLLQYYKVSIDSIRPEGLVELPDGHSFPAGEVLLATVVYGLIAAIARLILPRQQRLVAWVVSFTLIFLISVASIYLGLHWFTDVLGGLALGMSCVTFGVFIYRRFVVIHISRLQYLLLPNILALLLIVSCYNLWAYKDNQEKWKGQWSTHTLNVTEWWQAHPLAEAIYRSSMLKNYTIPLDLHWLGDIGDISQTLKIVGWEPLQRLTVESSLMVLSGSYSARLIPVFPKFHRDRLPSLVLTKIINENSQRIVLQLWASDYLTTDGLPLWVGTVRLESIEHRIPFVTFYVEEFKQIKQNQFTRELVKSIRNNKQWKYRKMKAPYSIFLIAPRAVE